jgi:SAM-dependent methyltransferase
MTTEKSNGHYYDDQEFSYPEYWKGREYEDAAERVALEKLLRQVRSRYKPGKSLSVLDIGAGYGRLADVYFPFSRNITFLEPSLKLVGLAKDKLHHYSSKIDFVTTTIEKASLPDNFYDLALAVRVIHHLSEPDLLFQKVFSSLKPGGFFILEFANKNNFKLFLKRVFNSEAKSQFSLSRIDRRSRQSIEEETIPFYNYHPGWVRNALVRNGYQVRKKLSVSNLRHPLVKGVLPNFFLLKLESVLQSLLSPFFFAPSIFILSQKPKTNLR